MSNEQEVTQMEEAAEQKPGSGSVGALSGYPGTRVSSVGVLDLRGVAPELVAQIESIESVGVVLLDEQNQSSLGQAVVKSVGAREVASADMRVLTEGWLEISKATVEGMSPGQKLLIIGLVYFQSDVPPALVSEKFEQLRVVGVVLAGAGVLGALMGRMNITGTTVTLPDEPAPMVRNIGRNDVTPEYLTHLPDGNLYVNVGATVLAEDVTEALLAQKIKSYYNIGATIGSKAQIGLLKARCPVNLGAFKEPGEDEEEEEESDEA
jgi:hypothetical protein